MLVTLLAKTCTDSLRGLQVQMPFNASASTAGALFSSSTFEVPKFQREYSWEKDEVADFWNDLRGSIDSPSYFLGLVIRKTLALLETLAKKASTPYAPRLRFQGIAALRKSTKTPPGFRDEGDGDFYIWVDFLTGLQKAQSDKQAFSRVVLVTMDRKIDWSRAGVAHPILVAEVKALLNVPFEIWTIDRLAKEIAAVT